MPAERDEFESTGYGVIGGARQSLVDLCNEAFLLIFHINGGRDPGHPDQVRQEISLLFKDLDRRGKQYGHAEEDIKATRYALCSLVDETILNSRWEFKDQWADRPLQLEYFGEHMAGERFFDLLDRIRRKGAHKVEVLEVFCFALILGFQGKYKLRGQDELGKLIHHIVREIEGHKGGMSSLAPHWQIPDEPVERPRSVIPRWVWITCLASVLTVLFAFIVFKLWLNSSVGEAAGRLVL